MCCVESNLDLCRKVFLLHIVNTICVEKDEKFKQNSKNAGVSCARTM